MPWFKVDDKLHSHRKTRKLLRSGSKRRDVSPLGLWTAAGAWSADNLTDGFIPADELEQWDDDAAVLAQRLVDAGLWLLDTVDGEQGFRFHDWTVRNPDAASVLAKREAESEGGRRGNHVRWHRDKAVPDCEFCATEKGSVTRSRTRSGKGRGSRVAGESSRPVPPRPDAAAAASPADAATPPPLPPSLEILKTKLDARKMTARWDRLTPEQHATIEHLIEVHGDGPLVHSALLTHRPDSPAAFAQAWIGAWSSLPEPGAGLRLVNDPPCPKHEAQGGTTRYCTSCAADRHAGDA